MNKAIPIFLLLFVGLLLSNCKTAKHEPVLYLSNMVDQETSREYQRQAVTFSQSGNAYHLMSLRSYLGANNAIIQNHKNLDIIEFQFTLIENIINSTRLSKDIKNNESLFKDCFRGWVSTSRNGTGNHEVPLYEGYAFFYIAQFLYLIHENGWHTEAIANHRRWNSVLEFVERHIWTKWYVRSIKLHGNPHRHFLRSRTHMGSHWAGVAIYLEKISSDLEIQAQCNSVRKSYDVLLRRNFRPHPLDKNAYVWNSTYDDVSGTFGVRSEESTIQDVSHGNHVISYIVAAYELGSENWTHEDILRLCNTVKIIYNEKENRFADSLDRSAGTSRRGWGNFQADGWIKLAKYDVEVSELFHEFGLDSKVLKRYNQELQFRSIMDNIDIGR